MKDSCRKVRVEYWILPVMEADFTQPGYQMMKLDVEIYEKKDDDMMMMHSPMMMDP